MFPRSDSGNRHEPALVCRKCEYRLPENWHEKDPNWLGMANRKADCVAGAFDFHDFVVEADGGDGA